MIKESKSVTAANSTGPATVSNGEEYRRTDAGDKVGDSKPIQIAITGYMIDRNDLVNALQKLCPAYDNHKASRLMLSEEINRIDEAVAALLRATSPHAN